MSDAECDMILARKLTVKEEARLKQVNFLLHDFFSARGHAVRVCEGEGEGKDRMIGFIPGLVGRPRVSLPADQFLTASDDELRRVLESRMDSSNGS